MAKKKIPVSLRLATIERDNYRCRACGIADVDALQADHITPASRGGEMTLENLQTLCGVCNNRKGTTNVGELPVRPPLPPGEGFGDYNTVMRERAKFIELVADMRQTEVQNLILKVKHWRMQNVESRVIRQRLEDMVGVQRVRPIMFHPDSGWQGVS